MYTQSPPIASLRDWALPLTVAQKDYICETLINTIKNYYVHLPIKEKAFALDPVQELRLLQGGHFDEDNALSFLRKLQLIFLKLNDRHTTLVMPEPWKNLVAFIPIVIERYYENDQPVYVITKKLFDYQNDEIDFGIRVTHWNGIPIDKYIEVLADTSQGANRSAAKKLALSNLTIRSLAYSFPPDEDWVTLSCQNAKGEPITFSFVWRVYYNGPQQSTSSANSGAAKEEVSLDHKQLTKMKFQNQFFGQKESKKRIAKKYVLQDYNNIMKYGTLKTTSGDVGYLRIFSFEVGNVQTFIQSVSKFMQAMPQDKLIIDIRENPGGIIPSGEQLVQLLSKNPITASPVAFRNTPSTKGFGKIKTFDQWQKSLNLMEVTAEVFTQYFALSDFTNMPTYRYPGKVALIIDSLVYSTSDFMAADFKDNKIGPIIGVDPRTGGGGANVWTYENLVYYAQYVGNKDIGMLPNGIGLNVAMRRSIRTGVNQGLPVEDLGTKADIVHHLTRNDLLNGNMDLLNFTASQI